MNQTIRNALAVVAGLVIGSAVNMGLITTGGELIPAPPGVDVTDIESLRSSMHLFEPRHFVTPFLAHALGTFAGAFAAATIAASRKALSALVVGALFLAGGVANVFMLPSPAWFVVLDLVAAYVPVAWLAGKWAENRNQSHG